MCSALSKSDLQSFTLYYICIKFLANLCYKRKLEICYSLGGTFTSVSMIVRNPLVEIRDLYAGRKYRKDQILLCMFYDYVMKYWS